MCGLCVCACMRIFPGWVRGAGEWSVCIVCGRSGCLLVGVLTCSTRALLAGGGGGVAGRWLPGFTAVSVRVWCWGELFLCVCVCAVDLCCVGGGVEVKRACWQVCGGHG